MPQETDQQLKDKLFDFWTDANEYYELAREMNLSITPERERMLSFIKDGAKVLDIGCGAGENGYHLRDTADYTGIEYSETALGMARQFESDTCRYMQGDAENLPFENETFDVVMSTHVIEHLTDPKRCLDEQLRVLKPGGRMIIIGPAWEMPQRFPPSCKKRAQSFSWRLQWGWMRFWKLAFNEPTFDMIEDPDILDGVYEEDNDTTYSVSVRRLAKYLKSKLNMQLEFIQTYHDVKDEWGHKWPHRIFWSLVTLIPMFRYANACLFIVAKK